MKKLSLIIAIAMVLSLFMTGCVTHTRDVKYEALPKNLKQASTPRRCTIEVAPVVNLMKTNKNLKKYKGNQDSFRYLVPLLLLNFWSTAGPQFTTAEDLNKNVMSDLRDLMEDTIKRSGIVSGSGKRYILKTDLIHLYGVNYIKSMSFVGSGGAVQSLYTFWPTGYASMKVTLVDADTNAEVASRILTSSYLLNPAQEECSNNMGHTAQGGVSGSIVPLRMTVACIALSQVMDQLPGAVDQMLSEINSLKVTSGAVTANFTVSRLTSEYDYQEELVVEFATGRIISDKIVRRTMPIVSRPGEWVVMPVQNGHWMEQDEYEKLVRNLSGKYKVMFRNNLTAAVFEGAR